MSLIGAALWVLGPLLGHIALRAISPSDPRWRTLQPTDGIAGLAGLASLAMFAYARKSARDPKFTLDLGLVYMVLGAAAVGPVSGGAGYGNSRRRKRVRGPEVRLQYPSAVH